MLSAAPRLNENIYYADDGSDGDHDFHKEDEQCQLLHGTQALNRASAHLHRAQQVNAQTDELAVGIMGDLEGQRSQLVRTRNTLTDIHEGTGRSQVLISTIACQTLQNRIFLIIIIVLEALVLLGVLFYKLYKRFH